MPGHIRRASGSRVNAEGWCSPDPAGAVTSKSPYVHLLFPYFSLTVSPHLTRGYGHRARLVWVVRFACPAWGRGGLVLITTGGLVLITTKEWWGI